MYQLNYFEWLQLHVALTPEHQVTWKCLLVAWIC